VEILAESLQPGTVRFGSVVTGFSEKPDGVRVMLKDAPAEDFDILVGADGINSAISATLFPNESKPSYAGFVTYVALAPGISIPDPHCYQEFFGTTCHGIGARVTGIAGGGRNSKWDCISVTVREANSVTNEWDNEATAKETRQILEDMGDSVPSWTLEVVDRSERIWKWGMFEHAQKRTWVSEGGRVAIMGDAAHAMVPYLGMGANSALMDAMVLSKELNNAMETSCNDDSIRAALTAYETARKETCEALVKDSRHKGIAMTATGSAASIRDRTLMLSWIGKKLQSSPYSPLRWCGDALQAGIVSAIDTADAYSSSNGRLDS
jgi:salicylate hydroxylase